MKIGMNLFLWTTDLTPAYYHLIPRLKQVGYEAVEVPISRANRSDYAEIRRLVDDQGLVCTTMFNLGADLNPISPDPVVRSRAIDELKWAIDTSRSMGSRALVGPYFAAYAVFSGQPPTAQELAWSAEVMIEAAKYAPDLPLSIEFLNRFETYLLNTAGQSMALVDMVSHSNFGILYDTHQAHHEESNITDAIVGAGKRINHVHFSESHRGTLGTGMVDWVGTVKALKRIGYDNWIMVESFANDVPPLSQLAHVWRNCFESKDEIYRKAITFVRDLWNNTEP
jgi:D-psicose/D-tagatose/L-ribulose 3-epimerase